MTTIKLKNGSGAPAGGDLVQGEPALDLTNKRLYTEDSGGTVIEVGTNPGVDVTFADNRKAVFGAGSDLQIYHDGSNSFVEDTGTGALFAKTNGTGVFLYSGSEALATFNTNGASNLYYDNALKLSTTSTGIDVTGTATMDGLTVSGSVAAGAVLATISNSGANGAAQLYLNNDAQNWIVNTRVDDAFSVFNATSSKTPFLINTNGDISFYEDTGTTAKLFWDASAESLGIGTSSPQELLHLLATTPVFRLEGGSRSYQQFVSGTDFVIRDVTATANRITLNSSGNVGIGTSSPVRPLSVKGSQEQLTLSEGDARGATFDYRSSTGNLNIATNGINARTNPQFTLDLNGNVGVGTSSPDTLVHAYKASNAILKVAEANGYASLQQSGVNSYLNSVSSGGSLIFRNGTAPTERMRIDSSGNLLVGTTDSNVTNNSGPASQAGINIGTAGIKGLIASARYQGPPLALNRLNNDGSIAEFSKDGTTVGSIGAKGGTAYLIGSSKGLRVSGSGVIPITTGGANSDATYDIGDQDVRFKDLYLSGSVGIGSSGSVRFNGMSDTTHAVGYDSTIDGSFMRGQNGMRFITATGNGSERMRIDSSGNLLFGTTSVDFSVAGITLFQNGASNHVRAGGASLSVRRLTDNGSVIDFYGYSNGSVRGSISVTDSATAYNTSSDQRLKDNIVDAPSASDDIDAIQVRSFDWKADGSHQKYGMVAQELNTVAPEAVSAPEDPEEMMGVDYSKLVPMLVKEIQSLRARVAQLETN